MHPFTYHRAESVADARARLAADPDAKLLAGGMTLLPSMKHRLAAPSQLVDIGGLAQLRGIRRDGDALVVGAGVRHGEIADDPAVRAAIPALAEAAACIGDPQVRARGTLGGSVANADPAADWPAAVLALDAIVVTDRRRIAAAEFFAGMFTTALEPDEIVVELRFACPRRAAYRKFGHPASGYALAGVFVAEHADGWRVAVTGAAPSVFRWGEAEAALARRAAPAALEGVELAQDDLIADLHAPAAYRARLVRVMTRRAIACLTGEPE